MPRAVPDALVTAKPESIKAGVHVFNRSVALGGRSAAGERFGAVGHLGIILAYRTCHTASCKVSSREAAS
jgi:hypothetical protein